MSKKSRAEFMRTPVMKTSAWYTVCPVTLGFEEIQASEYDEDRVAYPIRKGRGFRIVKERKTNDSRRWFKSWPEALDYVEGMLVMKVDKARAELAAREADLRRFLSDKGTVE